MSKMVPTTTLDDWLLPRLKLRRDDAFDAHMKVHPVCTIPESVLHEVSCALLVEQLLSPVVYWLTLAGTYQNIPHSSLFHDQSARLALWRL